MEERVEDMKPQLLHMMSWSAVASKVTQRTYKKSIFQWVAHISLTTAALRGPALGPGASVIWLQG